MKLVMAAFWVADSDVDDVVKTMAHDTARIPRIPSSGAVVSFRRNVVNQPGFRPLLHKFDLGEAADFEVGR